MSMKKGLAVGIGVAVLAIAVIIGIASLPDEVLFETTPIDTSENEIPEEQQMPVLSETIPIVEEPEPETEPVEEETEGQVIQINISDGVGSGDR